MAHSVDTVKNDLLAELIRSPTLEELEAPHQIQGAQESSIDEFGAPEARFECPICLTWLRDPVQTKCGHRFCRTCIQEWLEKGSACPVDMELINDKEIFPDNFTRREISQQRTKCPNILRGCLIELSPLDVEAHLLVCKFRSPELPENEKLRCIFVNVGCFEKFEDEPELQRHLEQNIQQHLMFLSQAYANVTMVQNQQPNSSSSSALAQANFWDPPSKEEAAQNSQDDNLQNLLKALYEKLIYLEQKTREQDIIIANMSDQISNYAGIISNLPQRYGNGCFIWYFNDFKNKIKIMQSNPRIAHYSPGFYTSPYGYKLCIRLNLSPKDPNYLAILVHLMKSEFDQTLDWPFCGRLSVTIVHPLHNYPHIKETMMSRPELEAFNRPIHDRNPKGFGYTEFASVELLLDQQFVANNQLTIKVNAQPV